MTTILKNTTASIIFINDVGFALPPGSSIIEATNLSLWASSADIVAPVTSGSIVINNGAVDLSPSDVVRYLQWPDRLTLKQSGTDTTRVVTSINVTGSATTTDNGNGAVTVDIHSGVPLSLLREVTVQFFPGVGPVDITSGLLFVPDPENDTILFLGEEII